MPDTISMKIIAHIHNDFTSKFAIPRQSGIVHSVTSAIIMEPAYRNPDAFRALDGYSHLWLLWQFSQAQRETWSPTVRPPKLGGNEKVGVFASRSPFRPNPIGLSCVKLLGIEQDPKYGPVLYVSGADLMDKTPIFDIKPYIPYADCHPDALGGYAQNPTEGCLEIFIDPLLLQKVPKEKQEALIDILKQDPRPGYHHEPDRIYGFNFAGLEIRFQVDNQLLTVLEILE